MWYNSFEVFLQEPRLSNHRFKDPTLCKQLMQWTAFICIGSCNFIGHEPSVTILLIFAFCILSSLFINFFNLLSLIRLNKNGHHDKLFTKTSFFSKKHKKITKQSENK